MQSLKQHWVLVVQETARSRQPSQNPPRQSSPPQQVRSALHERPRQGAQEPFLTRKSQVPEQHTSALSQAAPLR